MPRTSYETSKRVNSRNNGARDGSKKTFRKRSENAVTWDSCNPLRISAIVCLATTAGASPTFGYTRDGTSLVMGMWYKGERHTDYLSGAEELAEYFVWLTEELLELTDGDLAPYAMIATEKP